MTTPSDPQAEFQRTKEEPVTFFRLRALALAPQMGVTIATADESVAILVTAFGERWLNDAASDSPPGLPLPFRRHALGDMISTAGPNQVAEAFELAEYLRHLRDAKELNALIGGLKGQYHQTLLQTALAARLGMIGSRSVSLEPPAADGKLSDIRFEFEGMQYRAECYRPTVRRSGDVENEMVRIPQDCLELVKDSGAIFAIAIALNEEPSAEVRREVLTLVRSAVADLKARAALQPAVLPTILVTRPTASISVVLGVPTPPGTKPRVLRPPEFPMQGDDADVLMQTGKARVSDVTGIAGKIDNHPGLSRAALWLPPELREERSLGQDLTEPLARLGKRIESKLVQTRSGDGDRRIVVVDSWMTDQLGRVEPVLVERLRKKIVEAHDGVAGLLMLQRQFMPAIGRHGYTMRALLPIEGPTIPAELLRRLAAIDRLPP